MKRVLCLASILIVGMVSMSFASDEVKTHHGRHTHKGRHATHSKRHPHGHVRHSSGQSRTHRKVNQ